MGKSLTLIGYSSGLPDISEAYKLNQSYDLPHNDRLTPDKVLYYGVCYMIWRGCLRMVMLLVDVCWCRVNRYKPSKRTLFRILHQNRVQKIIQCHDKKIWKQMCIKNLCYSTETYLRYKVQRKKQAKIYMWALHHKLFLLLQSRNCFRYAPENETEGDILVWTKSTTAHSKILISFLKEKNIDKIIE